MVITAASTLSQLVKVVSTKQNTDQIITHLIKLVSQTKRLVSNAGSDAMFVVLSRFPFSAKSIQLFGQNLDEKNVPSKGYVIQFIRKISELVRDDEEYRSGFYIIIIPRVKVPSIL